MCGCLKKPDESALSITSFHISCGLVMDSSSLFQSTVRGVTVYVVHFAPKGGK